jgi:hypothetical protein
VFAIRYAVTGAKGEEAKCDGTDDGAGRDVAQRD